MRLAIISDIHGNLVALETVLADIKARGADLTVNLGDVVTSPLWPRETFELLATLNLPTVRGNHDRWIGDAPPDKVTPSVEFTREALTADQKRALSSLPPTLAVLPGVLAVHGTPTSDTEYLLEEAVEGCLSLVTPAVLELRLLGTTAEARALRPQPSSARRPGARQPADRESRQRRVSPLRRQHAIGSLPRPAHRTRAMRSPPSAPAAGAWSCSCSTTTGRR